MYNITGYNFIITIPVIKRMNFKIILVAIIKNDKGEILLVKRAREPFKGKWSLTGGEGAFEKEKDPWKAINIEVRDDFGADFEGEFYDISYEEQSEPTMKLFFIGKLKGEPFINSGETISEIKWVSLDEALKIDLAFKDIRVLKKLMKEKYRI